MCFSAAASFSAGAVLAALGTVPIRRMRSRRELPYALVPLLFAVQQFVEGALWLTLLGADGSHLHAALTHTYQFFSHVLWPIYIPLAIRLLEKESRRRQIMAVFAAGGAGVGLYLFYFLFVASTESRILNGHIDYISPHFYAGPVLTLYVLAACASSLISSHRTVRWFGIATVTSLITAAIFYRTWFISVWCFFAAVISITVLAYFRRPAAPLEQASR